jgi:hypothetical protein
LSRYPYSRLGATPLSPFKGTTVMTKYRVTMSEIVFYEIEVECDNESEVAEAAEEQFIQGDYKACGQDNLKVENWSEVS